MTSPKLPQKRERRPRLDLSLGSPVFVEPYWQRPLNADVKIPAAGGHFYFDPKLDEKLTDQIRNIHRAVGNAVTEGRHIVIGSGATQILGALVAVMKKKDYGKRLYAKPPYYFRFPDIVQMAGVEFMDMDPEKADIEIVTTPSNPMNVRESGDATKAIRIYDLCYNWPTYGEVFKADFDFMVFSLSKATGHAASRIGWAIVRDAEIAAEMREHIEVQSGGTAYEARLRALTLIRNQSWFFDLRHDEDDKLEGTVFAFGKAVLDRRWRELQDALPRNMTALNSSGMFALIRVDPTGELSMDAVRNMLRKYDVLGRSGLVCGSSIRDVRINLGCAEADFDELIRRLKS